MTEYFYRKIGSPDFEFSPNPKILFPVWLTNKFYPDALYYDSIKGEIEYYDGNYNAFVVSNPKFLPVEVSNIPFCPKLTCVSYDPLREYEGNGSVCIEDFDLNQMEAYLKHRYAKQRYEYDKANLKDENKLSKEVFGVHLESNVEELTFKLHVQTLFIKELQYDYYLLFDLRKGKLISSSLDNMTHEKWKKAERRYQFYNLFLKDFQKRYIPQNLRDHIFYSFLKIVAAFTNISYDSLCLRYRNSQNKRCLFEMYRLTMLPFEPGLWTVIKTHNFTSRQKAFNYQRTDSQIFKNFCKQFNIRNTKTVRRCFAGRPNTLITYLTLKACGFTDINLFNRVLENEKYYNIFDTADFDAIKFFSLYSIEKRGQKATMNTLLKISYDINAVDGLEMFHRYFYKIPEILRNDILYDGFTRVNHDALAQISYQSHHTNKVFQYSPSQQSLCDSIGPYDFFLPKDRYQLCEIGCTLHNCVASYDYSILKKQSTIICVKKEGKYKICIELCGKNIIQELGDKNKMPSEEEKKILDEWHLRHNLISS